MKDLWKRDKVNNLIENDRYIPNKIEGGLFRWRPWGCLVKGDVLHISYQLGETSTSQY